ncbi:MAG: hypothetical protein FJY37_00400 [Betaproteobacteria bacterium]|nr:hypothetical protein [Betaproteobacteria bacterium]
MKRFHTGGEGEASPLFDRHAEGLMEDRGFPHYRLVSYSEGIDSETLVARRWARGVIELVATPKSVKPSKRERLAKN